LRRRFFTERLQHRATFGVALLVVLGAVAASQAHFVVSRRSLRALIAESDLVVDARVVEVEKLVAVEGLDQWIRRPPSVEVLGVIKGPAVKRERIAFAQHGHGTAELGLGQRALVFLRSIARSRELQPVAASGEVQWYSAREHHDDWVLSSESRRSILAAARRYALIEEMLPEQRDAALRKITVNLLASPSPRLAKSALRDLVSLPDAPLVAPADLIKLKKVIDGVQAPIEIRIGLLAELERRGLLEGTSHWLRLLRTTRGPERLAVIPAAGLRRSAPVQEELRKILFEPDVSAASAAAVALGSRGNAAAVAPLTKALHSGEARLALAAIRSLGRIGTPEARAAIDAAAAAHPDPAVRRRAQAEARLLED
jgi:hypothetical protein